MTWNYRIIKHDTEKDAYFAVHEVFYDEEEAITGWTKDPIAITGDNKAEIIETLDQMIRDCKMPILKETQLLKDLS